MSLGSLNSVAHARRRWCRGGLAIWAAGFTSLLISSACAAQGAAVAPNEVRLTPTIIVAAPELDGTVSRGGVDATLWSSRLALEEVATVPAGPDIIVGTLAWSRSPLARAELRGSAASQLGPAARLYCSDAYEKGVQARDSLLRIVVSGKRLFERAPRICFIDTVASGSFDKALIIGRGGVDPVSIAPLSYTVIPDAPVPFAIGFRVVQGGVLQGPQIALDVWGLPDRRLPTTGALWLKKASRGFDRVTTERSLKRSTYPAIIDFSRFYRLTLLSFDPATRMVEARLDTGFRRIPVYFEGVTRIIYTAY